MLHRLSATRSILNHVVHRSSRVSSRAGHQFRVSFTNDWHRNATNSAPATTNTNPETTSHSALDDEKEDEIYNPQPFPGLNTLFPQSTNPTNFHNDLPSFLAYARRTGLDPASTVYRGTRYEYLVLETLKRYGFELVRVGGRGDLGWDLVGYWRLPFGSPPSTLDGGGQENPVVGLEQEEHRQGINNSGPSQCTAESPVYASHRIPIKVLIQCKYLTGKSKISPHLVRELEGAFRGAPPGWKRQEDGVLGLLVTMKPATKGVMQAMRRSERAVGWLLIDEVGMEEKGEDGGDEKSAGVVKQILWNQKTKEVGLEAVDVVKKYGEGGGEEVVLMYRGKIMDGVS